MMTRQISIRYPETLLTDDRIYNLPRLTAYLDKLKGNEENDQFVNEYNFADTWHNIDQNDVKSDTKY